MRWSHAVLLAFLAIACDPTKRLADPPDIGASSEPGMVLPDDAVDYAPDTSIPRQPTETDDTDGSAIPRTSPLLAASDDLSCMADQASLACWGHNDVGQGAAPDGAWKRVSIGHKTACAIDTLDGHLACWGDDTAGRAHPPSGRFLTLSVGTSGACAVADDHTVACWGGAAAPPADAGAIDRVAVGGNFTCFLKSDGASVACTGAGSAVASAPTSGAFTEIVAGDAFACALDVNGSLRCWGENTAGSTAPPAGSYKAIAAGNTTACAAATDGTVRCWGANAAAFTPPESLKAKALALGRAHACATTQNDEIRCWGDDKYFQASPPETDAVSVEMALGVNGVPDGAYGCTIRKSDQRVTCFGTPGALAPAQGLTAKQIALARNHACALSPSGALTCWGNDTGGSLTVPLTGGTWDAVSVTDNISCGLRGGDGALVCWGQGVGASLVHGTDYTALATGDWHTCALSSGQTVYCLGGSGDGQTTPPAGTAFTQIGAGVSLTCGVTSTRALACWGDKGAGRTQGLPSGDFHTVDAGVGQACAIRTDGSLACWGANDAGQATPPKGAFRSVSAADKVSCGVRTDGRLRCWGDRVR